MRPAVLVSLALTVLTPLNDFGIVGWPIKLLTAGFTIYVLINLSIHLGRYEVYIWNSVTILVTIVCADLLLNFLPRNVEQMIIAAYISTAFALELLAYILMLRNVLISILRVRQLLGLYCILNVADVITAYLVGHFSSFFGACAYIFLAIAFARDLGIDHPSDKSRESQGRIT